MSQTSPQVVIPTSIFHQSWWLDATAEGAWRETIVYDGEVPVAGLPYVVHRRLGLRILTMPRLTQSLGPWYADDRALRLSGRKKLTGELIEALPRFDIFSQSLQPALTDWQPFYWKGFTQTTLYTYVIEDLTDLDRVYRGFASGKKSDIQRARRQVEVRRDMSAEGLYKHLQSSLAAKGEEPSYPFALLKKIHDACYSRSQGRTYFAEDSNGNVHAATLVIWDVDSAYFLVSSVHPAWRSSGAGTLLMWEAIQDAAKVTRRFNFEGSMIESVERSYRAFGGTQTPYSHIVGLSRKARIATSGMELAAAIVGRPPRRL